MAVTHATTVRNTIADTVLALLNVGSPTGAKIEFQTSGDVEVATLTMAPTAFGAASSGTATANAIESDTNATGGTITKAVFKDANGTEVFRCSVTASGGGGDIELSSVIVSAGQTVSLSSLTYAAPA